MRTPKRTELTIAEWETIEAKEFWKNTSLKETYGKGITISPDQRFTSLMVALKSYYSTYEPKLGGGGDGGHDSARNIYPTVVFMSMFIEKFLVAHFDKVKPWVSRGNKKEKSWTDEELREIEKTIYFDVLITRLYDLLKEKDPSVDTLFCFIGHREAILKLSAIRNHMVHIGNSIPKTILIDVLFVNHLLPLVLDLLESQNMDYRSIDRHTHCGIRVLNELRKITLMDEDLKSVNTKNRKHLDHLKALGRAAIDSPIFLGLLPYEKEAYELENAKIAATILATMQPYLQNPNIVGVYVCPCCGVQSLLTSGWIGPNAYGLMEPSYVKCRLCHYSIHFAIGNPSEFNLMEEEIFQPILRERWLQMNGAEHYERVWKRMSARPKKDI